MPDRYEIVDRGVRTGRWALHRIDDDPEWGFDKMVGTFDTKVRAQRALQQIEDHENRNFAEYFYAKKLFYEHTILDQGTIAKHLYKLWRAIGGNMTIDAKRDILTAQLVMLAYVVHEYELVIDDLEEDRAIILAGEDW